MDYSAYFVYKSTDKVDVLKSDNINNIDFLIFVCNISKVPINIKLQNV